MADEAIGGVQAVQNIPSARLRVSIPNAQAGLAPGLDAIETALWEMREKQLLGYASDHETNLTAAMNAIEFNASQPENASQAALYYKAEVDKLLTDYDMQNLPPQYQDGLQRKVRGWEAEATGRMLHTQNEAINGELRATDTRKFSQVENDMRKFGAMRGGKWQDQYVRGQKNVSDYVEDLPGTRADMGADDLAQYKLDTKEQLWYGMVDEMGEHNADGALALLAQAEADGLPMTQKLADLRDSIKTKQPGQNGAAAGNFIADQVPLYGDDGKVIMGAAEQQQREIAKIPDSKARAEARTTVSNRNKATEITVTRGQEKMRGSIVQNMTALGKGLSESRRTGRRNEDGDQDGLTDAEQFIDPAIEMERTERVQLEQAWMDNGGTKAEFDHAWDTFVVEAGDVRDDVATRTKLDLLPVDQLVDVDLYAQRHKLSEATFQRLLKRQEDGFQTDHISDYMSTLQERAKGKYKDTQKRAKYVAAVEDAVNYARREAGGVGRISPVELSRIEAQVTATEIAERADATAVLNDVLDNGTALEQMMLGTVTSMLSRRDPTFAPDPNTVMSIYNAAMAGALEDANAFEFSRKDVTKLLKEMDLVPDERPDPQVSREAVRVGRAPVDKRTAERMRRAGIDARTGPSPDRHQRLND